MTRLYSEECSRETRNRIRVALAARAYEKYADPIMTDAEFDKLALEIDLSVNTHRPDLDKWFRREFSSATGSWVGSHPDKDRLDDILEKYFKLKSP